MHCGGKRKQFFVFQLANFYQVTSNHLDFRPIPRVLFERPFIDMLRITVNVLLHVISLFGPLPNSCTLSHVHHEHNDGIYCSWSNYALRWCKAPIIIPPNPTALQSKIRLPVQIDVMAFDFSCKSCSAYFDCALIPVCWCNLLLKSYFSCSSIHRSERKATSQFVSINNPYGSATASSKTATIETIFSKVGIDKAFAVRNSSWLHWVVRYPF